MSEKKEDSTTATGGDAPPSPPRVSLEEAAGAFDGAPHDPEGARRGPPPAPASPAAPAPAAPARAARAGGKGGARRGPKEAPPPPPPPMTEEERKAKREARILEARGALKALVGLQKKRCVSMYKDRLPVDAIRAIVEPLELEEEELEALAEPVADGMDENGLALPWWGRALLVFFASGIQDRWAAVQQALDRAADNADPGGAVVEGESPKAPPGKQWDAQRAQWVDAP